MRVIHVLIILLGGLLLITSAFYGPVETSEARYAEISREMYVNGDFIHPTLLNIYHYHKPPLTYWITAISFHVFGVNTFALRFPLVISLFLQYILIFRIALLLWQDEKLAFLSGWVYASMPVVLISVQGLTTDAYLMTFILLGTYMWMKFLVNQSVRYLYGFSVSIAIAFLTKGPVCLVLPFFIILSLRNWRPVPEIGPKHGTASFILFLLIAFSWYVVLLLEDSRFFDYFFFKHTVDRLANAETFSRSKPFYYYFLIGPVLAFPWIGVFIRNFLKRSVISNPLLKRVTAFWFILPLLFFSAISSKLPLYILPIFAGLSMITAYGIRFNEKEIPPLVFLYMNILMFVLLAFAGVAFAKSEEFLLLSVLMIGLSIVVYHMFVRDLQIVYQTFILVIGLIGGKTIYFKSEHAADVDTTMLTKVVIQNRSQNQKVLIFDELLPSVAFHLNEVTVSIFSENNSVKREVLFQNDDNWRNFWLDFNNSKDKAMLRSFLLQPFILIAPESKVNKLLPLLPDSYETIKIGSRIIITHR